jgi:hypothetical protein
MKAAISASEHPRRRSVFRQTASSPFAASIRFTPLSAIQSSSRSQSLQE